MYHRGLVALRGADANLQANQVTVRVADATGAFDTGSATEWTGKALPPRVAGFQKDFITKYMDPTEIYARMDQLTAADPDIMQAIELPHKTAGYQRQANVMLEGTTVNPSATTGLFPNPSNARDTNAAPGSRRAPVRCSCSRRPSAIRAATTSRPSSRLRPPAPGTRRCRSP